MLKFKGTYEIISPEDIGLIRANDSGIVLGKLRYEIMFLTFSDIFEFIFQKKIRYSV